jgi:hypothetical protein
MTDGVKWLKAAIVPAAYLIISLWSVGGFAQEGASSATDDHGRNFWPSLIAQAKASGLPTQFLIAMDPGFVTLEFDDLHAFAAEYHPEEHHLILNRSLSFNGAGGALKPLTRLTPRELGTLFHELFHAYMDYISISDPKNIDPMSVRLLEFARDRQQCLYQQVSITPIMQRKTRTEVRFLTERESWEVLNETWAVFVGWAIWTKLEAHRGAESPAKQDFWSKRLKKADQDGDLIGYYEPENNAERSIARKRYLSPSHRITPEEVKQLLEVILEFSLEDAYRSIKRMKQNRISLPGSVPCHEGTK